MVGGWGGCALYQIMSASRLYSIFLGGRDPSTLTVAELKLWLQERKKSTKGKKTELVARFVGLSNSILPRMVIIVYL